MGKSSMSQKVQQEAQHLVELLAKLEGDVGAVLAARWQAEDTQEPPVWPQSSLQSPVWVTRAGAATSQEHSLPEQQEQGTEAGNARPGHCPGASGLSG